MSQKYAFFQALRVELDIPAAPLRVGVVYRADLYDGKWAMSR
jgi:hypothetical protein